MLVTCTAIHNIYELAFDFIRNYVLLERKELEVAGSCEKRFYSFKEYYFSKLLCSICIALCFFLLHWLQALLS